MWSGGHQCPDPMPGEKQNGPRNPEVPRPAGCRSEIRLSVGLADADGHVVPPEAQGVAEGVPHLELTGVPGDVVQVALGVGGGVVARRVNRVVVHSQRRVHELDPRGGTKEVPDHGSGGTRQAGDWGRLKQQPGYPVRSLHFSSPLIDVIDY